MSYHPYTDEAHDPMTRLTAALRPDEQLLWSGHPDPSVRFSGFDLVLIPFTALWCAGVLVWEALAIATESVAALIGVPFVCVGLYVAVGRFAYAARVKRRTAYAVTSQRALLVEGTRVQREVNVAVPELSLRRTRDGRHVTVLLGPQGGVGRRFGPPPMPGMIWPSSFLQGFAFVDVGEPDALLHALDVARGAS